MNWMQKIHPLLLKNIIERFTDLTINRKGGQLIFTSHDLSTMNSELFRRDEIWFVAKGVTGRIQIYTRWLNLKMIKGIYSKRMRSLTNSIWKEIWRRSIFLERLLIGEDRKTKIENLLSKYENCDKIERNISEYINNRRIVC